SSNRSRANPRLKGKSSHVPFLERRSNAEMDVREQRPASCPHHPHPISTSARRFAYSWRMSEHHHHDHDHSDLSETELRVRALETVLTEKGYVEPAALDLLIETYETKVGPRNGAHVVARAWSDPEYRKWLLADATAAINSLGYA